MAAQPKSNQNLTFKKVDAAVTLGKTLIKYLALVLIARYSYLSIAVLAGKETFASIGLSILGNVKLSEGIYITVTIGSIVYGLGQRQLRRRNIERLTGAKKSLEETLDKKRSSSRLTPRGTTRPEDQT